VSDQEEECSNVPNSRIEYHLTMDNTGNSRSRGHVGKGTSHGMFEVV
jgi:hypothetical protein